MHLVASVFAVVPGAVSDELESADDLTDREESENLGGNDSSSYPLLLGEATYAVEDVDGLGGA